jgi:signal transduction histidine kinase
MSDSPLPDTPIPLLWDPQQGGGHPDTDVVELVRSRLRRIALFSVAVVAVLGVAGVLVIAADQSQATLVSVSVVVGCVAVVLVAATRAASAARVLGQLQWAGPAESVHSTFGDDPDQRREVFGKLARRLQSLINRAIRKVDGLEREIEDPEILRGLYEIDHLATRVRRQAENLAVLGGEAPQRRSSTPVSVYAVLRSAVAEIEHYKQITIVAIEGALLHGHVVAEIIHLLAELLENATTFTAPDSPKVVLRAQKVTAGLAIEVQDRGLGMTVEDLQRINRLLDGSAHIDIGELLQDGRIGLAVVKELSVRHNVRVRLQTNIFGGIDAAVVLPHNLIADPLQDSRPPRRTQLMNREVRAVTAATAPAAGQSISGLGSNVISSPGQPMVGRHGWAARPPVASGNGDPEEDQHRAAPGQQLPALPVREPGTTLTPAPSAAVDDAGDFVSAEQPSRPPLPRRRGQSHLRPELLEPAAPTRPLPGHNTNLMATVQQGLERGRDEHEGSAESPQPQYGTTQGEFTTWPMI